jgi:gluconate 2-dehydrogenase subunit 3-like protein
MPTLSRRTFLASLASAVPLAVVVRRAHAEAVAHLTSEPATLDALAEAILPSALGRAGITKEVADFREWGKDYREGAEVNHGYGTSRLRSLGPTPLTKWTTQLDDLDARAQSKHQKSFREIPVADRVALVRAVLEGQRVDRMPGVADASHVSLALLAHFYDSSAANDLCYEAKIGKATCRPLATSSRKPLPMLKVSER